MLEHLHYASFQNRAISALNFLLFISLNGWIAIQPAYSQLVDDDVLRQMRSMSHRNHELVGLYYDRDFAEHIDPIHTLARDTLLSLEQKWGVTLPRNQFQIYLHFVENDSDSQVFQKLPSWVSLQTHAKRGELHFYIYPFSDFEQSKLDQLLPFQLTYMVISHLNTQLSDPLRAAIARYHFPFSDGRQLFIGIDAMREQTDPFNLLEKPAIELTSNQKLQLPVFGAYFIDWLFQAHPSNQSTFMQQVVQDIPLRRCLAKIGQEDLAQLQQPFIETMQNKLAYTNLFKTRDFWLLILGILILAAITWHLIATLTFALSADAGEEIAPGMQSSRLVDEADFQGPAFGSNAASVKAAEQSASEPQPTKIKPPLPPLPPKATQPKPPQIKKTEPQPESDDQILSVDGIAWEEEPRTAQSKPPVGESGPNHKRPPKIQPPKIPAPEPAPQPAQEGWEADIDNIFDDLVLGDDER